ncbi:MAG: LPS export ABC transporter ATP-binding protein [Candidatus Muproteobacteria bacterium RBG_19FT_COMBO_61_10]|jgi:lipopolysaccharide export system ATP-binding protein|uniref:Lipopolysaccharide export system ATP-binding protein LptB n=1 Tax=Candidatus Muproteobacteria bacterium RBG_19FT_COMBO_61_10 TaxID=1817761 RepID=A0A1F6UMP1_9PROT|nr:MAG: LPS export ABC transporter ATP-binding protein [Candidatus Muproteobacteria bacterium RBG_19FT_COMBO_61_10]
MSTLSAKGLHKQYKGRQVVNNVSVSIESGQVVGLLGPNGAGKTTCFYMIVGLIALDSGSIFIDGTDVSTLPMHRRARLGIGYLPQEPSVFRKLTVEDNILAILETLPGLNEEERNHRLEELLQELHITERRHTLGMSLSGGERRRVEIARALATRPRFILLDEPFAGVDPISVLDIQHLIGHLQKLGIGVLITDHNVRETLKICDRAYILNDGKILASGTPAEILYNEEVKKVYLGEDFRL